ncbi:hypothetical protein CN487_09775 [Bacillus cereus]|nr:hypothetical protein CN487_09775 [Bacillus cereus]
MGEFLKITFDFVSVLSILFTMFLIIAGVEAWGPFLMFPIFLAFLGPEMDLDFELMIRRIVILGIGYAYITCYIYLNIHFIKNIAVPFL